MDVPRKSVTLTQSTHELYQKTKGDEDHMRAEQAYFTKRLQESLTNVGKLTKMEPSAIGYTYEVTYNGGKVDNDFRGSIMSEFPHIKITTILGCDQISLLTHKASTCKILKTVADNSEYFQSRRANNFMNYGTKIILWAILATLCIAFLRFIKPQKYMY